MTTVGGGRLIGALALALLAGPVAAQGIDIVRGRCAASAGAPYTCASPVLGRCYSDTSASNAIYDCTGSGPAWTLRPTGAQASANTASALVQRDGSGNFSAGTITAALTGNASTATTAAALTANPADCSSNQFANAIAASGDLTCSALTLAGAQFANQGTTTTLLHGNGSGNPSFGAVSMTADVTGTLPVANGGTGAASHTAYALLAGGTTSTAAEQSLAGLGTSGQVLTSNGAGALPTFQAASSGSGDVVGPSSSVDNALVRFDGTTGKLVQDYTSNAPTCGDTGICTFVAPVLGAATATSLDTGEVQIASTGAVTVQMSTQVGKIYAGAPTDAATTFSLFSLSGATTYAGAAGLLSAPSNALYLLSPANLDIVMRPGAGSDLFTFASTGDLKLARTITAAGTTGAQTINKAIGTVNFAAGATSVVVTNALVTTSSVVFTTMRTADTTCTFVKSAVPASGSVAITVNAGCNAETSVGFWVTN